MHKNKRIIFRHGLGFSNNYWNNMLPFFQKDNCILVEENYFNQGKVKKIVADYSDDDIEVGIGHSLGFWKLCQELPKAKYLIGINAFTNFLGKNSQLRSARISEYEMFKTNFHKSPKSTLESFYKRCGIEFSNSDFSYINIQRIAADLSLLAKQAKIINKKKILIINSIDDMVVPKIIAEDNFSDIKVKIHYFQSGKHGLGFLHAKEVSKIILDFIE